MKKKAPRNYHNFEVGQVLARVYWHQGKQIATSILQPITRTTKTRIEFGNGSQIDFRDRFNNPANFRVATDEDRAQIATKTAEREERYRKQEADKQHKADLSALFEPYKAIIEDDYNNNLKLELYALTEQQIRDIANRLKQ